MTIGDLHRGAGYRRGSITKPSLRFTAVIGTYASAILICAASIVIGRAICVLSGNRGSTWLGPAVGFGALMIICEVAITLPGRGWTAVAALLIASAASVWIGVRRRARWPAVTDILPVGLGVLLLISVPFVVNARVGVLGVSFLNDTHWHLILAEGLRHPSITPLDGYGPGYPVGPHAVAATFAQLLGSDVDKTLTGVLMAVPILTAVAALGMLDDLSAGRRWLVAALAGIPYLAAASYAESAFKEPILSLLMVGLVLVLQAGRKERFARPAAVLVPAGVLVAAVLYDYSYPGLAWPAAIIACWLLLELVFGGAWTWMRDVFGGARAAIPALVAGGCALVIPVLPDLRRIHTFWVSNSGTAVGTKTNIGTSALANLAGPLHSLEGLNVWLTGDFRFVPNHQLRTGVLCGMALILLVFAVTSALRRRDLIWPAAMLAFALIYFYAQHRQSPYVAAKALAIPAPLLVLGSGGALMRRLEGGVWRTLATWLMAAAGVAYISVAFASSYLVLRDAQVDPVNHTRELRALRPALHGRPTLALFYDDYLQWELLGVPVSSPLLGSPIPAPVQDAKPWTYGQALDFDSVDAATLNRFDYVITTRTSAQSEPPPNFHLVATSPSYAVWHRVGPTAPRSVLPESGHPGALLDCASPPERRLSRTPGRARVRAAPLYVNVAPLQPGGSEQVQLRLAPGTWDLSLPFISQQAITIRGAGLDVRLPPNLDRSGSIWPVGRVTSTGAPITLTITMADPSPISSGTPPTQFLAPEPVVAVSTAPAKTIPLREACGRYVDWYQLR